MLFLSLTSLTKNKQSSIQKFTAFFQFRAIWNILALVNKFSLYPLHGKAINGKAQIFETLRLWRPLEQREYAASQLLTPKYSYLQQICLFCLFSSPTLLYCLTTEQEGEGDTVVQQYINPLITIRHICPTIFGPRRRCAYLQIAHERLKI